MRHPLGWLGKQPPDRGRAGTCRGVPDFLGGQLVVEHPPHQRPDQILGVGGELVEGRDTYRDLADSDARTAGGVGRVYMIRRCISVKGGLGAVTLSRSR